MNHSSSTDRVIRYIIIAIALVAVAAMVWTVAEVLVIAFGAIVVATVLRAMAVPLSRATGWRDHICLVLVILASLAVLALLSWLFGRQAAHQFAEMRQQLPAAAEKFQAWLAESRLGRVVVDGLKQIPATEGPLTSAGAAVAAVMGGFGNLLLIVFAGAYLAADPRLYRNGALRLLPPARRPQVGRALDDAGTALHQWLIAQVLVMVAVGLMTGVGLALLGVPLALSLGLLTGLLEFVPVVGPIVATIPGVLLAFTVGPETAAYALLVYVLVQQIESNLLTPLVQRWAVELPPVVALLSIVVCGLLFGVPGVIFATPIAVVTLAMVKHLYVEDTLEQRPARRGEHPRGPREAPRRRGRERDDDAG